MEMITKIDAAERQLDTAIKLFFENIAHLSSYTLAAASREITDDLCDKKSPNFLGRNLSAWVILRRSFFPLGMKWKYALRLNTIRKPSA
jgi:hypothetical protein